MEIFLDTSDCEEVKRWSGLGLVDGITTNPTLIAHYIAQSNRPFKDILLELCKEVNDGLVSAEVTATDYETMMLESMVLREIAENIVIKVPLTPDGLKACHTLALDGVLVNVTLCFSAGQALLAAKAGAAFVSPFVGRLEDHGENGVQLIRDIRQIFDADLDIETMILAASIRSPLHVVEIAKAGADIATIPPKVLEELYHHPLTDAGITRFTADWKKTGQSIL